MRGKGLNARQYRVGNTSRLNLLAKVFFLLWTGIAYGGFAQRRMTGSIRYTGCN